MPVRTLLHPVVADTWSIVIGIIIAAIAEAGRLLTAAGPFSGDGSVAAFDLTEGETFGSSDAGQSFVPNAAVGPGVWSDGTTMWGDRHLPRCVRVHAGDW